MLRCLSCGLHFFEVNDLPPDLYARAYSGEMSAASMREFRFRIEYLAQIRDGEFMLAPAVKRSLAWLEKHAPPSSVILDVGCGWGVMLRALRARGFQALGLDLAPQVATTLAKQGFRIHVGPVESYPQSLPEPAFITNNFVLHHPSDPVAFLRSISTRFPRSPLLLVEGLYPNWMYGVVPTPKPEYPRQLTLWTREAIATAMERAGYARLAFLPTAPSAADVQLPLTVWLAGLLGRRAASAKQASALKSGMLFGAGVTGRLVILAKRALFSIPAAYARQRHQAPASILAIAYPPGAEQ
jgi:hypothetical protein